VEEVMAVRREEVLLRSAWEGYWVVHRVGLGMGGVYLDHLDAFCGEGLRVRLAGVARYAANLPLLGEVGVGKDGADH
jgi:hypothetical protein